MTVYFDKENLVSYLKTAGLTALGRDTLRMVKNQFKVHLNFKIEDLDDDEVILASEFQEGVSLDFKITTGEDKIARPMDSSNVVSRNPVYLLNDSDIKKIRDQQIVIVGGVDEGVDALKTLIINQDYGFHLEQSIGSDITHDRHLDILGLPFSTLVIIDRYVFAGPHPGGNISFYEYNLDKILKSIYAKKKGISKMVFVYQLNPFVAKNHEKYESGPDLEKLSAKLKKVIAKHCPAPEIFLIGVPKGKIEDEHDRFILSNYLRIKSGDSFIYFDSANKIMTKSKTVDLYSLAFRPNRKVNASLVVKIRGIVTEALEKFPAYSKIPTGASASQIINLD